jgi:hypothetical protein
MGERCRSRLQRDWKLYGNAAQTSAIGGVAVEVGEISPNMRSISQWLVDSLLRHVAEL